MDEKIKILMTLGTTSREGAQTYSINVLRNIDQKQFQIDFAVNYRSNNGYEREMEQYGCKIHIVPKFRGYNYWKYKHAWTNLFAREKYDIVHVHGARANFIAALLKPRINVPVITTVHSDYKLDFTESLYKKLVFTATNTLALRLMDYYIGVSDNFKRMLVSRGFNPNKVYTVYNGMDYDKPADFCSKEEFAKNMQVNSIFPCSL